MLDVVVGVSRSKADLRVLESVDSPLEAVYDGLLRRLSSRSPPPRPFAALCAIIAANGDIPAADRSDRLLASLSEARRPRLLVGRTCSTIDSQGKETENDAWTIYPTATCSDVSIVLSSTLHTHLADAVAAVRRDPLDRQAASTLSIVLVYATAKLGHELAHFEIYYVRLRCKTIKTCLIPAQYLTRYGLGSTPPGIVAALKPGDIVDVATGQSGQWYERHVYGGYVCLVPLSGASATAMRNYAEASAAGLRLFLVRAETPSEVTGLFEIIPEGAAGLIDGGSFGELMATNKIIQYDQGPAGSFDYQPRAAVEVLVVDDLDPLADMVERLAVRSAEGVVLSEADRSTLARAAMASSVRCSRLPLVQLPRCSVATPTPGFLQVRELERPDTISTTKPSAPEDEPTSPTPLSLVSRHTSTPASLQQQSLSRPIARTTSSLRVPPQPLFGQTGPAPSSGATQGQVRRELDELSRFFESRATMGKDVA
jgi:hypothetical protein